MFPAVKSAELDKYCPAEIVTCTVEMIGFARGDPDSILVAMPALSYQRFHIDRLGRQRRNCERFR